MATMNFRDAYNPTKGVKTDFSKLLEKFSERDSVRYEQFAEVWRSMKFSFLSAGRMSDRERREFFEEVIHIALSFYLPPYNFQVRVGGLYILYGIYITQPCLPKVPIRVTPDQWKQILEFQKGMTHLDVSYIFHKLFCLKAFVFVATPKEVYIKARDRTQQEKPDQSLNDNLKIVANSVNNIFTSDIVQQLQAIHTQYHQLKLGIAGPNVDRPDRSLDVIGSDIINNLDVYINEHKTRQNKIRSKQKTRKRKKDQHDSSGSEDDIDNTEDDPDFSPSSKCKQASVKAQAFANKAKQSKGRRHRVVVTQDASASSPGKTTKKTTNKQKKVKGQVSSMSDSPEEEQEWFQSSSMEEREEMMREDEEEEFLSMPTLDVDGPEITKSKADSASPKSKEKEQNHSQKSKNAATRKPAQKTKSKKRKEMDNETPKSGKTSPKKTPMKSENKGKGLKVKLSPVKKTPTSSKGKRKSTTTSDSEGPPAKQTKEMEISKTGAPKRNRKLSKSQSLITSNEINPEKS